MAGTGIDVQALRVALSNEEATRSDGFAILKSIACLASDPATELEAQELVLRALDKRECFGSSAQVLDGLVRHLGLFPYLEPEELGLADRLAYELHRPANLGDEIVFHRPQAAIYRSLMAGENVVLSAPTSFGKSLIIDAAIASGRYSSIVIIVPTIALIDETRRRLSRRFSSTFKVITHPSQQRSERNLFVLTQERFLDMELEGIDLFIIDEFYKLSPGRDDDGRCMILNQVVYRLLKTGAQFYMLGPNIEGLAEGARKSFKYTGYIEKYRTVVAEVHDYRAGGNEFDRLTVLCERLDDATIIFCRSPNRAATVATKLIEAGITTSNEYTESAASWIGRYYHPEWHFTKAIQAGIGIHHARLPRALAQDVVRAFNGGDLRFLICTSTLIEGVNTKAKNIVVFDNTINRDAIDYFTFSNIQGRSGRMGRHFVGNVYLFHDPPQPELPFVDVPALSQNVSTPKTLLIQLDQEDLSPQSRERLQPYLDQGTLSYETLRENVGMDLDKQIGLAGAITREPAKYHRYLRWNQSPSWEQLSFVCNIFWEYFDGGSLALGSVTKPNQLAFMINDLRRQPSMKEMVDAQVTYWKNPDKAIQRTLDFIRLWATFHFPKLLRTVNQIQKDVFHRLGLPAGEYEWYAASVENLFLDPTLSALEEYGVPLEISRSLQPRLQPDGDLDAVLLRLRSLNLEDLSLDRYEIRLLSAAQASL